MEHYFEGKTVLVTGAGFGVGAAAALLYAAYGAKVIVSDTSRKGGKNTLAKIKNQKGNATYIRTDVSNQAACKELIKKTIRIYGSIDIACNNSNLFSEVPHPADGNMESSDNQAGLNLASLNNCMKYEIEAMRKQSRGVIVNIQSIMGPTYLASSSRYIEAKYGTETLLQNILGAYPAIHIHTIAPPFIATALLKEKVAKLILWLSSDETYLLSTVFNDTN
jgi:NAD(P)-dependent dehydrogenase (short-subunit alcohol dehydrogenase family)